MLLSARLACAFAAFALAQPAFGGDAVPLRDWAVPAPGSGIRTLADATQPLPFIGLPPCRIVDTRGGAPLGGGYLPAATPRNYTLTGQCGIPSGAAAVSLNVTVTNTAGPGFIMVYPQGGAVPTVSTLNYVGAQTIANAAIVPLSGTGGVTFVAGVSGTDLVVDTNGYFARTPADGNGFDIYTTTAGHALLGVNYSTSCTGVCGIFGSTMSSSDGAIGIGAFSYGSTGKTYGLFATTNGTGLTGLPVKTNSAGVYGLANSTTDNVSGVMGETVSIDGHASGVTGLANQFNANAGSFYNAGAGSGGIITYLATGAQGVSTSGGISGSSLVISGAPKSFISPHPEDPSKEINYVAIEGPSADVYFRGTARLTDGVARIEIPDHFRLTAREGSYMATVTPVGTRTVLFVEEQGPDGVVVRGSGDAAFNYVVWAERDETRDHQPVQANAHFTPEVIEKLQLLKAWPERTKALLVRNGTLEADGTYNRRTAARMGWSIPAPPAAPPGSATPDPARK